MKIKKLMAVLLLLALAPCMRARAAEDVDTETGQPPDKPRVVSVRQALTQPEDFKDERVMLVGAFMGFNGGCDTAPPIGAGDIMIHDRQGLCIYANGPLPQAFDPMQRIGLGEPITLSGFVMTQESGPPFFLVPYNKKSQQSNAYNARAMFLMRKAQQSGQIQVFSLEQVLRTPDKYVEKPVALKGLTMQSPDACAALAPAPAQPDQDSWVLGAADGRCLRIAGLQPEPPEPSESDSDQNNRLVTIKGYLYKDGEHFIFLNSRWRKKPRLSK